MKRFEYLRIFIPLMAVAVFPAVLMGQMRASPETVLAQATQADGKVIVGGRLIKPARGSEGGECHLLRRNQDGSTDSSFTSSWTTSGFNAPVHTLALQADQKILVGGEFTRFDLSLAGYIVRLNSDGSIDPQFSHSNGVGFDDAVTSIHVEASGKIWVSGLFEKFDGVSVGPIVRLNPDGSLDTTTTVSELKTASSLYTL
jgi:uncharacterized delta-60 repeat protein